MKEYERQMEPRDYTRLTQNNKCFDKKSLKMNPAYIYVRG